MHPKADIAVIVGRFQVDELHQGHLDLIRSVTEVRYRRVIVALGVAPIVSKENPLDFVTRQRMIQHAFSDVSVVPINDHLSDEIWSKNLDTLIRSIAPHGEIALFGARDSFIKRYHGRFKTVELQGNTLWSGTEVRQDCAREVRHSADFRAGIIYGRMNEYDRVLPTVDIAATRLVMEQSSGWKDKPDFRREVLIGRKEDQILWRFPGGHVEATHESLEETAAQELLEETSLEVTPTDMVYLGSSKVPDWRATPSAAYHTAFFTCEVKGDEAVAGDDLAEVKWVSIDELVQTSMRPGHEILKRILLKRLSESTS